MQKQAVIIGGGGYTKVAADIIEKSRDVAAGFLDDNYASQLFDYRYLGRIDKLESLVGDYYFIIAVGANAFRKKVAESNDVCWYTAIRPTAIIGKGVKIGVGTVISAGTIINHDVMIGKHVIINTGAIVDHDDVIGDYVHLAQGVVLDGNVIVGDLTFIDTGACVKRGTKIASRIFVGPGETVS